jgi:hypothetical protein
MAEQRFPDMWVDPEDGDGSGAVGEGLISLRERIDGRTGR